MNICNEPKCNRETYSDSDKCALHCNIKLLPICDESGCNNPIYLGGNKESSKCALHCDINELVIDSLTRLKKAKHHHRVVNSIDAVKNKDEYLIYKEDVKFKKEITTTNFKFAIFRGIVKSAGTTYCHESITFKFAIFTKKAKINNLFFAKDVDFSDAEFRSDVFFLDGNFKGDVKFKNTIFEKNSYFNRSIFTKHIDFISAIFNDDADFSRTTIKDLNLSNITVKRLLLTNSYITHILLTAKDDDFTLNLNGSTVRGELKAKERFNNYKSYLKYLIQQKDTFRLLKYKLDSIGNYTEASKFYALEMKMEEFKLKEEGVSPIESRRLLLWLSKVTSNYFQSIWLPMFWLFVFIFGFEYIFYIHHAINWKNLILGAIDWNNNYDIINDEFFKDAFKRVGSFRTYDGVILKPFILYMLYHIIVSSKTRMRR